MKIIRILFGIFLIICGISLVFLSVYFMLKNADDTGILTLVGVCFIGIMVALGGFAICLGARIRDILDIFMLGSS